MAAGYEVFDYGMNPTEALEKQQQMKLQEQYRKDALDARNKEFNAREADRKQQQNDNAAKYLDQNYNASNYLTGINDVDKIIQSKMSKIKTDALIALNNGSTLGNVLQDVQQKTGNLGLMSSMAKNNLNGLLQQGAKVAPTLGEGSYDKLQHDITNGVIQSFTDPTTGDIIPADKYKPFSMNFNDPNTLSNYVTSYNALGSAANDKDKMQKDNVYVGGEYNFTPYTGSFPIYMRPSYDPKNKNKLSFLNTNEAPKVLVKSETVPLNQIVGGNDNTPINVLPEDVNNAIVNGSPQLQAIQIALAKKKYPNFDTLPDAKKDIAARSAFSEYLNSNFGNRYGYTANTPIVHRDPSIRINNGNGGTSDTSVIHNAWPEIEEAFSNQKPGTAVPLNKLNGDVSEALINIARNQISGIPVSKIDDNTGKPQLDDNGQEIPARNNNGEPLTQKPDITNLALYRDPKTGSVSIYTVKNLHTKDKSGNDVVEQVIDKNIHNLDKYSLNRKVNKGVKNQQIINKQENKEPKPNGNNNKTGFNGIPKNVADDF